MGEKRPEREAAFLSLAHIYMKLCIIIHRDKSSFALHQLHQQQVSLFKDHRILSHELSPLHSSLELLRSSLHQNLLYSIPLAILSQHMLVVIITRSTSLVTSALIWLIWATTGRRREIKQDKEWESSKGFSLPLNHGTSFRTFSTVGSWFYRSAPCSSPSRSGASLEQMALRDHA